MCNNKNIGIGKSTLIIIETSRNNTHSVDNTALRISGIISLYFVIILNMYSEFRINVL